MLTHTELSIIAIIGIILLIGLVKKNAILMIDFALAAERKEGKNSRDSIYEACLLRFRPIMMTTMAAHAGRAAAGARPGTGSELRRPLGITIIGGLLVSQALTLFTTPVVYLYFDRLQHLWSRKRASSQAKPCRWGRRHERTVRLLSAIAFFAPLGLHEVGPNYTKAPPLPAPPAFKELLPISRRRRPLAGRNLSLATPTPKASGGRCTTIPA